MLPGTTDRAASLLHGLTDRIDSTLQQGTWQVADKFRRTSRFSRYTADHLEYADGVLGQLLGRTPPSAPAPGRDWGYRPSAAESRMAARRMVAEVPFTGDMRIDVLRSISEVYKMRSDDGQLNIYKPTGGLDFEPDSLERRMLEGFTDREIAAYRLDEILGFGRIPPTARTSGPVGPEVESAGPGTIQQFIESPKGRRAWRYPRLQQQQVAVDDYIMGNRDRHIGNYRTVIVGGHAQVLAIDHARSFSLGNPLTVDIRSPFVYAQRGIPFEPDVLNALKRADNDLLYAALGDAGIQEQAIDGAITRLEKLRTLGMIPPDVLVRRR
ncbi:phosphatidylinositol 4-kinase [Nocardia donostiensis]|uniref:phosphatidylinositol 4-kinase n=1 Tax=Nocardia donostiensis TaxID=1538463 RepID=UPI0020CA691E|nr:phosphatidylinositol 4-kinase [Nocardia donostiensis]